MSGKIKNVAAGVAVGESLRSSEGIAVVESRSWLSPRMPDRGWSVYVPDDVGIRLNGVTLACGKRISCTCIVRDDRVDDAEGRAGLEAGQVGDLPSTKHRVQKPGFDEERNVIDQTDRKNVPLVEVRTRSALPQIVAIDYLGRAIASARTFIDSVAIGVGYAAVQTTEVSGKTDLERVVARTNTVDGVVNSIQARVRTIWSGSIEETASDNKMIQDISGNGLTIH